MSDSHKNADIIDLATQELTFLPNPEQRRTKAAFWAVMEENPLVDRENVNQELVIRITGDTRLKRWWGIPGFRQWFTNQEEFRQRMEYLSNLVLDTYEDILSDPKANPSAKVAAGKVILEVAKKMPSKQNEPVYADANINNMNRKQLEEFIRKNMQSLPIPVEKELDEDKI